MHRDGRCQHVADDSYLGVSRPVAFIGTIKWRARSRSTGMNMSRSRRARQPEGRGQPIDARRRRVAAGLDQIFPPVRVSWPWTGGHEKLPIAGTNLSHPPASNLPTAATETARSA